jgi:hypothetical protein
MAHCVEEAERIFKSCGKTYELADDGTYQVGLTPDRDLFPQHQSKAMNPMSDNTAVAIKQICDCLGASPPVSR